MPMVDQELLELAKQHHRNGELLDAERIYRQILANNPEDPEALHLMGLVAHQHGSNDDALDRLRAAIKARPGFAQAHNNLGVVLKALDRLAEADEAFLKAMEADPAFADACFNHGTILQQQGRLAEAVGAYGKALALNPESLDAALNLGAALKMTGRLEESIEVLAALVARDAQSAVGHYNLGLTLLAAGKADDGIAALERAVALDAGFAEGFTMLGKALWERGASEKALRALLKATELRPDLVEAQSLLYKALHEQHDPLAPEARYNLATALLRNSDAEGALKAFDVNLEIAIHNTRELGLKAVALVALGRDEHAAELLDYARFMRTSTIDVPSAYENLEEFNTALADALLANPTLAADKPGTHTSVGMESDELFTEQAGEPLTGLLTTIQAAVDAYWAQVSAGVAHPFLENTPRALAYTARAVVMEGQGYQVPHMHGEAWLSGVYYVRVPSVIESKAPEHVGWLEFGCPDTSLSGWANDATIPIQPREGRLVLFPSYFHHQVLPFASNGQRISVAFDVLRAVTS